MFNHAKKTEVTMEKKAYQTPSIEVVNISTLMPLLGLSSDDVFNNKDGIEGSSNGGRANGRRWASEW